MKYKFYIALSLFIFMNSILFANANEKILFATNWLAQPEHGGFYQAIADNEYSKCGLDVEIIQGGPQVNNRAKLIAGKIDFYMGGNMIQPILARSQGIPIKVVAAYFQKDPQIIMTHKNVGMNNWEDAKKTDPLYISDTGFVSFYQWMINEHNFKEEQRRPYTFNSAPFIANKNSGQQGYLTSEPFSILNKTGEEPNVFLLSDYGFNSYSTTIETMEEQVINNSDVVECFINASSIGWVNYLYGNPEKANALIKYHNPDITDKQIAYSIEKLKIHGIIDSGSSLELGIGSMTDVRQKSFYNKMVKSGILSDSLNYKDAYTLKYVNKGIGLKEKEILLK
jgi:NitT/TauT family transport system substrate-binding protein